MSFPLRSQEEGELASKASVLGAPGNSISEGKLPQQVLGFQRYGLDGEIVNKHKDNCFNVHI